MLTLKSLADGQLPNAKATLYTCPAGMTAIIRVVYTNVDGSDHTVNLYIKRSGSTSRRVIPMNMLLAVGDVLHYGDHEDVKELSAGDVVEGDADAATVVDYLLTGAER